MSIKALQEYTYVSKYARFNINEKRRETYYEATDRVRNMHLSRFPQAEEEINDAFEVAKMKRVLGSQRALQFGGTPILKKNARIYNCIASYCDRPRFFQECFWLLLCGCGTGFSVQKHHVAKLPDFHSINLGKTKTFVVPDTIEGWSDALGILIASYMPHSEFEEWAGYDVEFDFSEIRPAGSILASGVGKAPGPDPLSRSLGLIKGLLQERIALGYERLRPIDAYDIIMHASDAVLSGGVRRSATLCMFSYDDEEMVNAKTGNWFTDNPQRARSNNSAVLLRDKVTKEEFLALVEKNKQFGEPGFIWVSDLEALYNPCVEIGLYAYDDEGNSGWQACNLCEINGKKIKTKEDFALAAVAAARIGTLQASYTDLTYLGPISKKIIEKEALLGVSITGMMDNPDVLFDPQIQREMAELIVKTNREFAKKIGINPAARCTCVKPAGCQRPDTIVISSQGILELEEIGDKNGDVWQNHNFEVLAGDSYKKTTKFFVNGLDLTKKILLKTGMEIECTHNHKFKILREGQLKWVRADQIKIGDVVPYKVGGYKSNNQGSLLSLKEKHSNSNWSVSPNKFDVDLCWLLGLYTGDGSNHKKGIRIHGNINMPDDLDRAKKIIKDKFNITAIIEPDRRKEGRLTLLVNSVDFVKWLSLNNIKKEKSKHITIPKIIRTLSPEYINAFIDGYWCADGGLHANNKTRSWVTISEKMAKQLVCVLRALGQDCSVRMMPPSKASKGKNMRYWIQEKKGRKGNYEKSPFCREFKLLDDAGLLDYHPDVVKSIKDSESLTLDIEVPDGNTYLANSYISHNTTSCVLGTASGIHPHHAKRYFRRIQGNWMEQPLQYFKQFNPLAVEKSVWSANGTDEVISFCVEVPKGAKTKNELSAVTLLEHVLLTQQNWVAYGKTPELCSKPWLTHNVSNTINIRPEEWDDVANFIYDNREYFAGIALLPQSGDLDYPQAPMCTVYNSREIVQQYGEGSLFASGLIVDGLRAYSDNLWAACEGVLGLGEPLVEPVKPDDEKDYPTYVDSLQLYRTKVDWVRRAKQFAERYFEGDYRKMTYCLKCVHNWKLWQDLTREYVDVDFSKMFENEDNTKIQETIACSGGKCELR
jgi:intein/homing endonuclease